MSIQEKKPKKGGNALKKANVVRIQREHILPTIKHFSSITDIPLSDLHLIGSGGKSQTSGDIDLAIDINKYPIDETSERLLKLFKGTHRSLNKGVRTLFCAIPINENSELNGLVQVDLMFVDNVEWSKFAYHSEGDNSRYKAAVRVILLAGVAASIQDETNSFVFDDRTKVLLARSSRTFDPLKGLRRVYQYRKFKRDGTDYLEKMTPTTAEVLKSMYPELNIDTSPPIFDPNLALKIMFGQNVTQDDVCSAERLISTINSTLSKSRQRQTYKYAMLRAQGLENKLYLPKEMTAS